MTLIKNARVLVLHREGEEKEVHSVFPNQEEAMGDGMKALVFDVAIYGLISDFTNYCRTGVFDFSAIGIRVSCEPLADYL